MYSILKWVFSMSFYLNSYLPGIPFCMDFYTCQHSCRNRDNVVSHAHFIHAFCISHTEEKQCCQGMDRATGGLFCALRLNLHSAQDNLINANIAQNVRCGHIIDVMNGAL